MSTKSASSPMPVLIIIVLAAMSLVQFIAPDLLHPGLTLLIIGAVFLILYFVNWVREPLTLITGWVLAGFGLSFWSVTYEPFTSMGLPILLFGLGLAFIGIFLTSESEVFEGLSGRKWLLVPGVILLLVGLILTLEGAVGRDRLWGMVVPLIPSAVAIWYLIEWRKNIGPTSQDPGPRTE